MFDEEYEKKTFIEELNRINFEHNLSMKSSKKEFMSVYRMYQEEMDVVERMMFPNGRVDDAEDR